MKGIYSRSLLFILGTCLVAAFLSGCTQKDDVITPVGKSVLTLSPQNLPTPPTGMIYELWVSSENVVDTAFNMSLAISLGRFSYISNDSVQTFLDQTGNPRTGLFEMAGDFQTYRSVFVGLHKTADLAGSRPGAIMLIAYVPATPDIPVRMVFPQADSLWQATCRFNLEAVSDNIRSANDAHGVWFSSYRTANLSMPDTFNVVIDSSILDTIRPIICTGTTDTCNLKELKALYLWTVQNIRTETKRVLFPNDTLILGVDSFMHTGVRFDPVYKSDSSYPYIKRRLRYIYDSCEIVGADTNCYVEQKSVTLDIFSQDNFGLPVVSEWGWRYCGWVMSPTIASGGKIGALAPPAWKFKTYYKNWLPGDTGGVVPTGLFADITKPDSTNLFTIGTYVPPYPGEDFLNTIALHDSLGLDSLNMLPLSVGNTGSILLSMEPQNRLTTTANFPLIAFVGTLPSRPDSARANSVTFNMANGTSTLMGNTVLSFPIITVDVKRF